MYIPCPFIETVIDVEERVPGSFWDRFNFLLEDCENPLEPEEVANLPEPAPEVLSCDRLSPDNCSPRSAETMSLVRVLQNLLSYRIFGGFW